MSRKTTGIERRQGRYRIRWVDSQGARRSETFERESDARAALNVRRAEMDGIASGRLRERADQTILQASKQWLETRPAARRRDNESHLDHHILPFMGERRLPEVTPAVVQRFIRHLEGKRTARPGEKNEGDEIRTLRPASINNVLITLRKMMNDLDYPIRIKYRVPEKEYAWLKTPSEVIKFLDACSGWFRMATEIAVYAGLRKGEIAGLCWPAIDFDRGMIRVDRSYDGPTKSKRSRWVPLAPELAAALRRWRLHQGRGERVVLVNGQPITRELDTAKKTRRACRRAGVESIKFHELRDTYASHLAERVSLPIVGAVLGHASPITTARYAHIDTAGLARDERLHLSFDTDTAAVRPLRPPDAREQQS